MGIEKVSGTVFERCRGDGFLQGCNNEENHSVRGFRSTIYPTNQKTGVIAMEASSTMCYIRARQTNLE